MKQKTSRREFLRRSAALAGSTIAIPYLIGRPAHAAEEKLGVAVVGAGGMGGYAVDMAMQERLVAVCDIDEGTLTETLRKVADAFPDQPAPKVYYDYRKMLEQRHRDIDVVLVSTPDHHHAPAAIRAIDLGKHVFAQKPLAHNIRECYELGKAAKEKKVLTQMGNQGHCGEAFRRACEYLWAGAVGDVTETHTILGRDFGGTGGRPPSKPIPPGVHWDNWIGPAPYRDYHEGLHPFSWRSWRQFGTGTIGDMACHNVDCVYFALKIGEARTFTVECLSTNGGSDEMWPQGNIVRYDIPARAGMPPLKVHVYDHGGLAPDVMKQAAKDFGIEIGEDTLYIGSKGYFRTTGHAGEAHILPAEKQAAFPEPPQSLPRAHGDPIEDLFYSIRNGTTPASNFPEAASALTSFVLTGHLAQFAGVGKKVEWDVRNMKCTNMPELNEYVHRTYRQGWAV